MSQRVYLIRVIDGADRDISARIASRQRVLIGRATDAEVRLSIHAVSRRHMYVTCDSEERLWVEDLNSTHGTVVDGQLALERTEVFEGSMISAGGVTLEVIRLEGDPVPRSVGEERSNPSSAERLFGGPVEPIHHEMPMTFGMIEPPDMGLSFDDVLEQCARSDWYVHAYASARGREARIYARAGRLLHLSLGTQSDPFLIFADLLYMNLRWEIVPWHEGQRLPEQTLDMPIATFIEQFHQRYTGYR